MIQACPCLDLTNSIRVKLLILVDWTFFFPLLFFIVFCSIGIIEEISDDGSFINLTYPWNVGYVLQTGTLICIKSPKVLTFVCSIKRALACCQESHRARWTLVLCTFQAQRTYCCPCYLSNGCQGRYFAQDSDSYGFL